MKVIPFFQMQREHVLCDVPLSVSVGVFDGVHAGHQLLIEKICRMADTKSAVVTFKTNPKSILYGNTFPGDITTMRQKLEILRSFSIDYVVMIDFNSSFSRLTGEEFLTLLTDQADIRHIVIGKNFHCGRGGEFSSTNVNDFLTSIGIDVEIIPSLLYDEVHTVSSTSIRRFILRGDFAIVKKLMNRAYSLDMANIPQYRRDEAIYIQTEEVSQPLPPPGCYRVRCIPKDHIGSSDIVDIRIDTSHIIVPNQEEQITDLVFEL